MTKPDPGHDVVAERLRQHLNADHVPVGIITEPDTLISVLTELAGPSACSTPDNNPPTQTPKGG